MVIDKALEIATKQLDEKLRQLYLKDEQIKLLLNKIKQLEKYEAENKKLKERIEQLEVQKYLVSKGCPFAKIT